MTSSTCVIEKWKGSAKDQPEKYLQDLKGSEYHLATCKHVVNQAEEPTTGEELYKEYKDKVRNPRGLKQFQAYLRELKKIGINYKLRNGSRKTYRKLNKIKTTHKEVLKGIISSETTISMDELYPKYVERVSHPYGKRAIRNYLQELRDANEIKKFGNGPSTEYRSLEAQSRFKAVSIYVNEEILQAIQEKSAENSQDLQEEFNEVLENGLEQESA